VLGARCSVLGAMLVLGARCSREPEAKSYQLTGQILAVHSDKQSLTIKHNDIPNLMPGMTMTFAVKDPAMMAGREPGQVVKATLEVASETSRLTAIDVTGKEPIKAMAAELALAEGLLKEGDALPGATFVDQNGRFRPLTDWRGGPLAITFTYTRCPIPEFCPRMDRHFLQVSKAIEADPELRGRAKLLTISFDPDYDTPAVMKAHAKKVGADEGVWTFATGRRHDVELFAARFGVAVTREGNAPGDLTHNLRAIVVDANGTIRRMHSGNEWAPAEIVDDLRKAR